MSDSEQNKGLFNPGKAEWLREKGTDELDPSQLALLLALTQLETELGRDLSKEESDAVRAVAAEMDGADADAIAGAVQQMVNSPAQPERKLNWPELEKWQKDRKK